MTLAEQYGNFLVYVYRDTCYVLFYSLVQIPVYHRHPYMVFSLSRLLNGVTSPFGHRPPAALSPPFELLPALTFFPTDYLLYSTTSASRQSFLKLIKYVI